MLDAFIIEEIEKQERQQEWEKWQIPLHAHAPSYIPLGNYEPPQKDYDPSSENNNGVIIIDWRSSYQ